MMKLSDHQGDEAIEMWADLLEPMTEIFTNEKVREVIQSGKPRFVIAKVILHECKNEAVEILQRIDPEPINGLNLIVRLMGILAEVGQNEEIKSFFGYAEQAKPESKSSGLHMVSIEAAEN